MRGYLPLIWKDFSTHMHGLAVYVKERLSFARDLSLENSADSYLCDSNVIRSHIHLVRKRTPNHVAKLASLASLNS